MNSSRNMPLVFAMLLTAGVLIAKGAGMFRTAFGGEQPADEQPESLGQSAAPSSKGPTPLAGAKTVQAVFEAAGELAGAKPAYVWGGGHGTDALAGADCSGAISYVLARAGLLSGSLTSTGFMVYGEPGPGRYVTIWANPTHVIMSITLAGVTHWFGTSGFGHPDAPNGTGANWFDSSHTPTDGYLSAFTPRHPSGL